MGGGAQLTGQELNDLLRPHAEALVWTIFPAARRDGAYLCVGSLDGEPGQSLKVKVKGHDAGAWADYAMSASDPRGKGDLIKLLALTVGGGDIAQGFAHARRYLNLDTMDPKALERQRERAARAAQRAKREAADDQEKKRFDAEGLWLSAAQLTPSSAPVQYMLGRAIDLRELGKLPGAIRFHHAVWHDHLKRKLPAMVTKCQTLDGRHAATHVTYLELRGGGWRKLGDYPLPEGETKRRQKIIRGPAYSLGAHIQLWKGAVPGKLCDMPEGSGLECSEGIEDGLSYAMANRDARVLAAGTLGIIGELRLPRTVTRFNILAQNDAEPEPIAALEDAIRKQQLRAKADSVVRTIGQRRPPEGIKDWNDWLRGASG